MQGLLNNPYLALGSGLLSVGGPSLNPGATSLGRGLSLGMQTIAQNQALQAQQEEQALRMQMSRMRMQEYQNSQRAAAEEKARREDGIRTLLANAPEDKRGLMEGLLGMGATQAAVGLLKRRADLTGTQKEYEQAQAQGFKGTLLDYKRALAEAGRSSVSVRVNDVEKPVGKDADKFVMGDGSIPSPILSVAQIVAQGGRAITSAETKARNMKAERAAKTSVYVQRREKAEKEYTAAKQAFEANANSQTKRALDTAAHQLQLAKGQEANIEGEPSDFVSRGISVPGAFGTIIDQLMDPLLRGMLGGQPAVPPGKPTELDFNILMGGPK